VSHEDASERCHKEPAAANCRSDTAIATITLLELEAVGVSSLRSPRDSLAQQTRESNDMLTKKLGSLSAVALALAMVLVRPSLALASEPLNNTPPWFNPPGGAFKGDASVHTATTNASWGTHEDMTLNDVDYHVVSCGGLNGHGGTMSRVWIFFTHAQGDIDLKVYSTDGVLLGSSQGVTNTETVDVSAWGTGAVVMKVYGYNGVANAGGYSVEQDCNP